jgi:hypothetical protein
MATKTKTKTKISSQAVMDELKTLALLTGGVVIGSMGGKMIDTMLKVDPTLPGFNAKAFARPVLLVGAGTAANLLIKNPNIKMLGVGVGAAGVLSGVKLVMKKDLLAGLADFSFNGVQGFLGEPSVYREPISLSVDRYNPDLPVLSSTTDYPSNDLEGTPAVFEII